MPICNVKFYVGGREYKTLCNTVKNADSFRVKFTVAGHSANAEISDKCYFKTIDGIVLNGVKTEFHICKDYLNMKEFIYSLKDTFDVFINTALHDEKIVGTVDELLWTVTQFPYVDSIFNKNEKMVYEDFFETAETESETKETSTEIEPETPTEIESAEETVKKTEIAVNMLKYGIAKTKFLPTEIFDTKEERDYWFKSHKFPVSLNRVFILKDTFTKRSSEGP